MSLNDLPKTSAPALRALMAHGVTSLKELARHSEAEIANLHGMGPKALRILKDALRERGLQFAKAPAKKTAKTTKAAADGPTAKDFVAKLKTKATAAQRKGYERYFPNEYKDFIGVRMGTIFAMAKDHIDMPIAEIEKLLDDKIREARVGAVSIMGKAAAAKKVTPERQAELYKLYLRRHDRINTWDLVDLGAQYVVGRYLLDKKRAPLYEMARSRFWPERRTALVATFAFIRNGEVDDAFKIAEMLLRDKEDFVHKAAGWVLRTAGDVDRKRLLAFLDKHAAKMPRVMLRYAIEKLSKVEKVRFLGMGKA
jgi:3-methyladenine DNA glycosylase AlkD